MTDKEGAFRAWEQLKQSIGVAYYIGPKNCKLIEDALKPKPKVVKSAKKVAAK